ncbi:hypothetical protein ABZ816_34595 [Actinosynnema sp. NPDC047251]|uniref:Putative secreted protein n=1 Tax=Saccharothrix espanaensis (strain ATCC 51144 / DSM 44229 / JCM 9112 / NBRC 15066 / NRRL 15764) TaxID=1179773 RepID=K0JWH0_SACES|nr:hypothetical protein [Saccharothrix espanaensis]CCH32170.1 putative secreted protein [Saccharothrix espanaensis DSM 44229]
MSFGLRSAEFAQLRLVGVSRRQVLRATGLDIPLALPWGALAAVVVGCVAVLLTTSVLASAVVVRGVEPP